MTAVRVGDEQLQCILEREAVESRSDEQDRGRWQAGTMGQ